MELRKHRKNIIFLKVYKLSNTKERWLEGIRRPDATITIASANHACNASCPTAINENQTALSPTSKSALCT